MHGLLLASQSPRRRELLARVGFELVIHAPEVDERPRVGEAPPAFVCRVAEAKAAAIAGCSGLPDVVVSADTAVVHRGRILGKPSDLAEARGMIAALAGDWHEVLTGYCVGRRAAPLVARLSLTRVRFRPLGADEIAAHLALGEWRDKAGGYAIQGGAAHLVAEIAGSYTNVVGLPLAEVVAALAALGVTPAPLTPAEAS